MQGEQNFQIKNGRGGKPHFRRARKEAYGKGGVFSESRLFKIRRSGSTLQKLRWTGLPAPSAIKERNMGGGNTRKKKWGSSSRPEGRKGKRRHEYVGFVAWRRVVMPKINEGKKAQTS